MAALLLSFTLFAFAWLIHVAWWRCKLPRHHMRALIVVFTACPIVAAGVWLAAGIPAAVLPSEIPAIAAFYLGAAGCYFITYAGVEETSPSLVIVRALGAAGETGCSREELEAMITQSGFVGPRLEALRRDGLIIAVNGGSVLTWRGRWAAQIALSLARVFSIREHA